jgi:hypothetical protein
MINVGCRYLYYMLTLISLGINPGVGIIESYGGLIFSFLRNFHSLFYRKVLLLVITSVITEIHVLIIVKEIK